MFIKVQSFRCIYLKITFYVFLSLASTYLGKIHMSLHRINDLSDNAKKRER